MAIPVICCCNQKGGVGKTLTTRIIAEWFSFVRGKRVLLADLDMQCNSSDEWIGMDLSNNSELKSGAIGGLPPLHPEYEPNSNMEERSSIADIFWGQGVLPYSTWISPENGHTGFVDVLCGHPQKLETINTEFNNESKLIESKVHNALRNFFNENNVDEIYDIVLLDTGPSRTPLFRSAIRAASHIIIPFRPEEKDIQGISVMLQVIEQENYSRPNQLERLRLIGLLPNMVRHTKLHKDNLSNFLSIYNEITIPKSAWLSLLTAFPERDVIDSKPRSIFELAETSIARKQSTNLCKHIESVIEATKP